MMLGVMALLRVEAYLKRVSSYLGSFGWLARLICIVCVKTHHSRVDVVLVFLWGIWKGISNYKGGGYMLWAYYMQRMKPTVLICFLQYMPCTCIYLCWRKHYVYMYVYLDVTIVHCTTVTFKTVTKSNSDCEVCIAGRPPSASFHRAHLSHNGGDIVMLRLAEIQISNSALWPPE